MDICEYAELFYNGELTEYQRRILRVYDILPKREDLKILMSRGGQITWVYKDGTPIDRKTLEKCRRIINGD